MSKADRYMKHSDVTAAINGSVVISSVSDPFLEAIRKGLVKVILSAVEDIPDAGVVEVTRCEKCRSWNGKQAYCELLHIKMDAVDYCSYGKQEE